MDLYNIKLRLQGALHHEVRRQNVPAPEVILLNALHGGSAIVEMQKAGALEYAPYDHRKLRAELLKKYGQDGAKEKHIELIKTLFGGTAGPLPESITMADVMPLPEEEEDMYAPFVEAKPAANAIKQETIDAKEAVRESIRKLGGTPLAGNASIGKLREQLAELQIAANGAPPAEDPAGESAPDLANVLGD